MKKIKKVDFFLVGAAKSGSTLLNDLLDQNPSISMLKKESHYFSFKNSGRPLFNGIQDNNFSKSVIVDSDEYNKMISRAKNSDFIGESSVFNLFYSDAAKNIYDYNKNAKIIIIIRNPINRAYSAYHYLRGKKREMESTFENALNKEDFKIKNSWEPIWYYKTLGLYHDQIKRYFNIFPKKQILVIKFEDFIKDKKQGMLNVERFLEIPEFNNYKDIHPKISGVIKNELVYKINQIKILKNILKMFLPKIIWIKLQRTFFSKPIISKKTYKELRLFYKNDIKKVEELTSIDLKSYYKNNEI